MRSAAAVASLLLTAACLKSVPPGAAPAPRAALPITTSFGKTWDASVDMFAGKNIGIKTIDRSSGLGV